MKCKNCGADNSRKAVHCKNCGEALNASETNVVESTNKNEKLEEIQQRRLAKKHKEKRKKVILISLVAIICIGGLSYGAYELNKNFFDRTKVQDNIIASPTAMPSESAVPTETALPTETLMPTETEMPQADATEQNASGWTASTETPVQQTTKPAATKASTKVSTVANESDTNPMTTKKPVKTTAPQKVTSTKKPIGNSIKAGSVTQTAVPMGQAMTSQLIKGAGLVTDSDTGNSYLKFTIGNKSYYGYNAVGKVNNGAYSYYVVDGAVSAYTYKGLPVYEFSNVGATSNDGYIIAKSSTSLLTMADIQGLTKKQLELARNEIYARHGRTFKKAELQNYFSSKSWYKINKNYNYSNDALNLNNVEKANAKFILSNE